MCEFANVRILQSDNPEEFAHLHICTLFVVWFHTRQSLCQPFDLAIVIGLMLAYMKPFAIIIGRFSAKKFWIYFHQPLIITFAECCKCYFSYFRQCIRIVFQIMALD